MRRFTVCVVSLCCFALIQACANPLSSSKKPRNQPPGAPVLPKPRFETGIPDVYNNPNIKRVAVLQMDDDLFTDYFIAGLVGNSKWSIIDRANLDKVFSELKLQQSGQVDERTIVKIGKLAGVQMVVFGQYRGDNATVRAIDVKSGKYLVYRVAKFPGLEFDKQIKARYALRYFLPWRVTIEPVLLFGNKVGEKSSLTVGREANVEEKAAKGNSDL